MRFKSSFKIPAVATICFCLIGGTSPAVAQTITEIIDSTGDDAGNGLNGPIGIAVDTEGKVYVPGLNTNNAFKITPPYGAANATEIIDAGNGLNGPFLIAVDAAFNVYVTGLFSNNAFKITPAGDITEIIDADGDGMGNVLNGANVIAVDAEGNVYVGGNTSNNAFKITPPYGAANATEIIDAAGDGAGNGLNGTSGIAVDAAGNVYVGGFLSDNAFKITPPYGAANATVIIDAGSGLNGPRDIKVDAAFNVYVAGGDSHNAFKITPAGDITEIIDVTGDGAGNGLNGTSGIAVDAAFNVYVGGFLSNNAFKITPPYGAANATEIIDATGDGAGNGLSGTEGIAVDASGHVYVAGEFSNNAFKISPACPWDIDGSGDVGVKDLLFLLGTWGPCPPKGDCLADFDDSGDVGVKDLLFLLGAWGPCP